MLTLSLYTNEHLLFNTESICQFKELIDIKFYKDPFLDNGSKLFVDFLMEYFSFLRISFKNN